MGEQTVFIEFGDDDDVIASGTVDLGELFTYSLTPLMIGLMPIRNLKSMPLKVGISFRRLSFTRPALSHSLQDSSLELFKCVDSRLKWVTFIPVKS